MPLVFIHGVSTRITPGKEEAYYKRVRVRDDLFREFLFRQLVGNPAGVVIENPYWGRYAARFAWDHASLPRRGGESFGADDDEAAQIVAEALPFFPDQFQNSSLRGAASLSLESVVDTLWAVAGQNVDDAEAPFMATLARRSLEYAVENPEPQWLHDVETDAQLVEKLLTAVVKESATQTAMAGQPESFGLNSAFRRLQQAAADVGSAVLGGVMNPAVTALRPWLHRRISLFVGDVLWYLDERGVKGKEGPIIAEVSEAIAKASRTRSATDPLVIVGHSMGGNIAYDILTHFHPEFECDVLLTVGSQVGMFEELKRFRASDRGIPSPQRLLTPMPQNVQHWINVFDRADVLGFAVSRIFEGAHDYEFKTRTHPIAVHSKYFERPLFHKRLSARVMEAINGQGN